MKHKKELGIFAALLVGSILFGAWQAQNFPNGPSGGGLPTGLTFASPTLTVSSATNGNGQICLSGNTSGTACLTAPAVAGTSSNALVSTNTIQLPAAAGLASIQGAGYATPSNTGVGFPNSSGNQLALLTNGTACINLHSTFGIEQQCSIAGVGGNLLYHPTTSPTISSGFGTSPSIATANGTLSFTINVGTGGTATSGVIGFPTAAHGWDVDCKDITTSATNLTRESATTTTTATVTNYNNAGTASAWTASDILSCKATAN